MVQSNYAKKLVARLIKRSHATTISVQPTAPRRRVSALTGRKKLSAERKRRQAKVVRSEMS